MAWRQRLDQLLYQGGEGHGKSGRQRSTTRLSPSTMKRRFSSSAERVPCAMGVSFTSMEHFPAPAATSRQVRGLTVLRIAIIDPADAWIDDRQRIPRICTNLLSTQGRSFYRKARNPKLESRTPAINRPSRVRHPGIFNWPEPVAVPARSIGASRGGAGRNRKSIP